MFTIKNVNVITCEEKPWEMNGKSGFFYPSLVKMGDKTFNITSKIDLREYSLGNYNEPVSLECELQAKTPKTGNGYTGIRITAVV